MWVVKIPRKGGGLCQERHGCLVRVWFGLVVGRGRKFCVLIPHSYKRKRGIFLMDTSLFREKSTFAWATPRNVFPHGRANFKKKKTFRFFRQIKSGLDSLMRQPNPNAANMQKITLLLFYARVDTPNSRILIMGNLATRKSQKRVWARFYGAKKGAQNLAACKSWDLNFQEGVALIEFLHATRVFIRAKVFGKWWRAERR